jgi:hypothetical protein
MTTITGYKQDHKGSYISKDPAAQLVYQMDWTTDWMPDSDQLASAVYTVETITGDSAPLAIESSGITGDGLLAYVELSGGSDKNIYTVTCTITTVDGITEARRFRIKCEERFA